MVGRRTVSYPKYLMEQVIGRQLGIDETVDHKDGDFNNNDINNLQVLPRAEHNRLDTRRVKLIDMSCPMCKKDFKRSPRILRDKAKSKSPAFCRKKLCSENILGYYN